MLIVFLTGLIIGVFTGFLLCMLFRIDEYEVNGGNECMTENDATEQAYKNGYRDGKTDIAKRIIDDICQYDFVQKPLIIEDIDDLLKE